MAAELLISASVAWREGKEQKERPAPIEAINPGGVPKDKWASQSVFAVQQIKNIFKAANELGKISFLMQSDYARNTFKAKRDVDVIRISIKDMKSRSDFLNPVGRDLTVADNVEIDKKNKKSTVTLSFGKNAFTDIA